LLLEAENSRAKCPWDWQPTRAGIYNVAAGKTVFTGIKPAHLIFRVTHDID